MLEVFCLLAWTFTQLLSSTLEIVKLWFVVSDGLLECLKCYDMEISLNREDISVLYYSMLIISENAGAYDERRSILNFVPSSSSYPSCTCMYMASKTFAHIHVLHYLNAIYLFPYGLG